MDSPWRNLSDPIYEHGFLRPGVPALVHGRTTLTFQQFADRIGQTAVHLDALGVQADDVVALALPTDIDHVVLTFALLRIGAVPVEIPPTLPVDAQIAIIRGLGVRRAFLAVEVQPPEGLAVHPSGPAWRAAVARRSGDRRLARDADAALLLHLILTPGRPPRAVPITHGQFLARHEAALALFPDSLAARRPAPLLLPAGIEFASLFIFLANQLCVGAPVVLMPPGDAAAVAKRIAAAGDASCLIPPPLCQEMLALPEGEGSRFPKLRAMFVGAAPLSPAHRRLAVERLTPNMHGLYGSGISGLISVLSPADFAARGDSLGQPVPGLTLEIVDGDGTPVPAGTIGHIRCRGPGVAQPVSPGAADGWYYPGDLGVRDADGFLGARGPSFSMVRRRGVDVFLPALEQVLRSHQSVGEVAVLGYRVSAAEEPRVVAFVVPRGEPRAQDLGGHCRERLPAERLPDGVYFVKALPRDAEGRVDRRALVGLVGRTAAGAAGPR